MNWFFLGFLGVLLNSIGLCVFGEAIIHRTMAGGAALAGFFDGVIGLVLINLGVWLIAEAVKRRGRE
jgi:hypothetical protein